MSEVQQRVSYEEAVAGLSGKGFARIEHLPGATYKDNSTVIVIPTRGQMVKGDDGKERLQPFFHQRVFQSWQGLVAPMNQKRTMIFASGHEVGRAYDAVIQQILDNPELKTWKYIMTLEDDNSPPPDAQIRLLESIEHGAGFDAVSGIYFTKGDVNMPMAYGDPEEHRMTGILDFRPRDVRQALQNGWLMEVNGIAMGCALWRMDLFRQIKPPWFVTVSDWVEGKGAIGFTQDLYFCRQAKEQAKRFAVDFRVKVGHMDFNTGLVY
jgi:hypothetical protein